MDKSKETKNKWSFGKNWDLIGVAIFPYVFYIPVGLLRRRGSSNYIVCKNG